MSSRDTGASSSPQVKLSASFISILILRQPKVRTSSIKAVMNAFDSYSIIRPMSLGAILPYLLNLKVLRMLMMLKVLRVLKVLRDLRILWSRNSCYVSL